MKKLNLNIKFSIIIVSAVLFFSGCGDQALFDELATNRVKVIIKGTYESNNPRDWEWPAPAVIEDDSVYVWEYEDQPFPKEDVPPTTFMLDVAGMEVKSGKHSQYFANFRKTYTTAIEVPDMWTVPFFNGEGVVYQNNDMRPDFTWQSVNVYIRKMLFNNAKQFVPTGVNADGTNTWGYDPDVDINGNVEDMFEERTVKAFNFNLTQVLSYYDSLKINYDEINRIFPLRIPVEGGFIFDNEEDETVLEIRLVIKNFVKKYEYEYIDSLDSSRKLRHFYALSDWLRDVKRDEPAVTTDTLGKMGRNLHAVARYYVPGKTATITGTTAVGNYYVAAIKSNYSNTEYEISIPAARPSNYGAGAYDEPKPPRQPLNPAGTFSDQYMQALLDYYLQYEVYKQYFDYFVTNVDSSGQYETEWNSYESIVSEYKIPQLVTFTDNGIFRIENVPAGTYRIYRSAAIPVGALPDSFGNYLGTATVTEANFNDPTPVPVIP
ncbi:MAG: hypothetical protein JXN64_10605 [Spirochaetes bacterium]|nr:hypothetical protein [Spirochaetota bacterium]